MKKEKKKKPNICEGQFKALVKIYNDKRDSVSIDIKNTLIKRGFLNDRLRLTEKSYILLRTKNVISRYKLKEQQKFLDWTRKEFPSREQLFTKKL
jgi:hypothetical protein